MSGVVSVRRLSCCCTTARKAGATYAAACVGGTVAAAERGSSRAKKRCTANTVSVARASFVAHVPRRRVLGLGALVYTQACAFQLASAHTPAPWLTARARRCPSGSKPAAAQGAQANLAAIFSRFSLLAPTSYSSFLPFFHTCSARARRSTESARARQQRGCACDAPRARDARAQPAPRLRCRRGPPGWRGAAAARPRPGQLGLVRRSAAAGAPGRWASPGCRTPPPRPALAARRVSGLRRAWLRGGAWPRAWHASTSTLTNMRLGYLSASCSKKGAIILHGPHQEAVKSTTTCGAAASAGLRPRGPFVR